MNDLEKIYTSAEEHKMQGELLKASEEYKKLLDKEPDNIDAQIDLADIFYILGEIDRSIEHYEKVVKLKPNYGLILYRLGISYFRATKFYKAISVLDRVIELDPEHQGAKDKLGNLINDQELLYTFGIEEAKSDENIEALITNYHI